ncbi:hypothetical protein [Methanolobus sp. WCC4]|uniref:hypothetical protein n=1 Tax=Methanolobus sp. WCC4 TaxID=3125784 RepID=UPI0030F87A3E
MVIEIHRGYEVLPDNSVRFGIRITNSTEFTISEVDVILDYNETLFNLDGNKIQNIGNIPPKTAKTAKFILKPIACVHKQHIEADVRYRDSKWIKHVKQIKPKEIHCVYPFLKAKPLQKRDFLDFAKSGYTTETGFNFQGIKALQLGSFLTLLCTNRFYKVDEYSINNNRIYYFSSEAIDEKAYYLLTVVIEENSEGFTSIMFRATSDKRYGIYGFLDEIVSEFKQLINTVNTAKEIGYVKHEHIINIIDSVVQRTSFSSNGGAAVNIEGSIVQRSAINSAGQKSTSIIEKAENISDFKNETNSIDEFYLRQTNSETLTDKVKLSNTKSKFTRIKSRIIIPIVLIFLVGGYFLGLPYLAGNFETSNETLSIENVNYNEEIYKYTESEVINADEPKSSNSDTAVAYTTTTDYSVRMEYYGKMIPSEIEINRGDAIAWRNYKPQETYILVSDDGLFEDQEMYSNDAFDYTFDKSGTYTFSVKDTPYMTLKVTVN